MTVYGFNEDGARRIGDMTRRALRTPRTGAQRRRQMPILGGGSSGGGIDLSCACLGLRYPAALATIPIGSGFAMNRYNVNFPGLGILTLFHDGGSVWTSAEDVLTCVTDPADERDVYLRLTIAGFGTKQVMLEIVEVSSGDSLATWKNTTVGFGFNHATKLHLWNAKNIVCPEVEWPCSLCVNATVQSDCTGVCGQWVLRLDFAGVTAEAGGACCESWNGRSELLYPYTNSGTCMWRGGGVITTSPLLMEFNAELSTPEPPGITVTTRPGLVGCSPGLSSRALFPAGQATCSNLSNFGTQDLGITIGTGSCGGTISGGRALIGSVTAIQLP